MPIKSAGVVLHQYVNGNLIMITQPHAKITVTMKAKRLHMERQRPTSGNQEEGPNACE